MTYPTPTGTLPSLTGFTDADTVAYISSRLNSTQRASYVAYYQEAVAQDPAITPFEAYTAWATGTAIAGGVGGVARVEGGIPQAAATGAAKAIQTLTSPITSVTALIGKVGKFLDDLTSGAFWMRIAEVVAGLVLLGIGANHLFKSKPLSAVTRTAGKLAPLALA